MRYEKHNLNPKNKKVGDCVVRAIAGFTGKDYRVVYDDLCALGRKLCTMPNDKETYEQYLKDIGYEMTSHTVKKGEKRPTVEDFKVGKHLLAVANHLCFVYDDVLYDTFDVSKKAVYKSWKVKA